MTPKQRQILDAHQQHREYSCFQMAPELALKLAGILELYSNPFQNHHCWDGKGYEPYAHPHIVGKYHVTFETRSFQSPWTGMCQKIENELNEGNFPIVSLQPPQSAGRHGYVVLEPIFNSDFAVVTKKGNITTNPPCVSEADTLYTRLANQPNVDCLFWKAI